MANNIFTKLVKGLIGLFPKNSKGSSKVSVDFDAPRILVNKGLTKNGRFMMALGNEIIRQSDAYVPFDTGVLKNSAYYDNGYVVYNTPYARYQYYGKLMIDPETRKGAFFSENYGFWSRKGVKKVLTDVDLGSASTRGYSNNSSGLRGSHWVERMWVDRGSDILKGFERNGW